MKRMHLELGEGWDEEYAAIVRILITFCATLKSFTKEWLRLCWYARRAIRMKRTHLGHLDALLHPEPYLLW